MADVAAPGGAAAGAWHADGELLAAYAAGRLDVAGTWSVEAHLTSCAGCREMSGALAEPERLRRGRAALIATVDVPRTGVVERLLVRLGVPDHTARLLAATPALRGSWLLAVAIALAAAGSRLAPERRGGVMAAPTLLAVTGAAILLPARVALYAQPGSPGWAGAHQRWAMLLGLALAAFAVASRDPARDHVRSQVRSRFQRLARGRAAGRRPERVGY